VSHCTSDGRVDIVTTRRRDLNSLNVSSVNELLPNRQAEREAEHARVLARHQCFSVNMVNLRPDTRMPSREQVSVLFGPVRRADCYGQLQNVSVEIVLASNQSRPGQSD
jgi:hypothetical protein